MTLQERRPTFETVQWRGDNQEEVEAFIDHWHGTRATYLLLEDQTLRAMRDWFWLFVPLGSHVVYGPLFGANKTQADFRLKTPDELATQYETVAG